MTLNMTLAIAFIDDVLGFGWFFHPNCDNVFPLVSVVAALIQTRSIYPDPIWRLQVGGN